MKLFIAKTITEHLYCIEYDKPYVHEKKEISLSATEYDNPVNAKEGERLAREHLEDPEYWRDIGMLGGEKANFLEDFIDFKEVADYVLKTDGWSMTLGEYENFGEYAGEEIFFNNGACGQHRIKEEDVKEWLIPQEQALRLLHIWDTYDLNAISPKEFKKVTEEIEAIFEDNKEMSDTQSVLNKYYEVKE